MGGAYFVGVGPEAGREAVLGDLGVWHGIYRTTHDMAFGEEAPGGH